MILVMIFVSFGILIQGLIMVFNTFIGNKLIWVPHRIFLRSALLFFHSVLTQCSSPRALSDTCKQVEWRHMNFTLWFKLCWLSEWLIGQKVTFIKTVACSSFTLTCCRKRGLSFPLFNNIAFCICTCWNIYGQPCSVRHVSVHYHICATTFICILVLVHPCIHSANELYSLQSLSHPSVLVTVEIHRRYNLHKRP